MLLHDAFTYLNQKEQLNF